MHEHAPKTVLAIVCDDIEYRKLQQILADSNWILHRARTRSEAFSCLRQSGYAVVLSDVEMPDGSWREALADLDRFPERPRMVVIAPHDRGLWAEVLNVGGFDVLEKPLDRRELFSVLAFACRQRARALTPLSSVASTS